MNKIISDKNKLRLFIKLLKSKNYDDLYTMFGKNIYMLFASSSHKAKDIKKLMEEKNYPLIYNKYGTFETIFIKNFRRANQEKIKKLIDEEKYYELYELYGQKVLYSNEDSIMEKDVAYETGSKFKAKLYRVGKSVAYNLKYTVESLGIVGVASIIVISHAFYYTSLDVYKSDLIEHKDLVMAYDEKVTEYASRINDLKLNSDLDVVMKVMYDMWNEMEGYGVPEVDAFSSGRLAFAYEGGVGVCRNIADDFSARLNAINSEYNARNMAVYLNENSYTIDSFANIERNFVESEEKVSTEELTKEEIIVSNMLDELEITNLVGNHMVTIFEPIGKNYTLVVDVTNPSIGIIENGKIYMFSSLDGSGLKYKGVGQLLLVHNYEYSEVSKELFTSFISYTSSEELEQLKEEWGIEAQNESIKRIENLDINKLK